MLTALVAASLVMFQQPGPSALPPSPVAKIVVTPATHTLAVGDSVKLVAQPLDSAGKPVPNASIRWFGGFGISVDSASGVVRGTTRGKAHVYAMAVIPGRRTSPPTIVEIHTTAAPPSRVELTPRVSTMLAGQRLTMTAQVYAANNDTRDDAVTWKSSQPAVVRVNAAGRVEAVAPGQATVTASVGAVSNSLVLQVRANTVRDFSIVGGAGEARTGDVLRFKTNARDASGRDVAGAMPQWTLSPGGGLVDQDGAFVAYEPGVYTVTASLGTRSADVVVKVRPREVRRPTKVVGRLPVKGLLTAEFWPHPNGKNAYLSTIGDRVFALDITNPASPVVTDSVVVDARIINDVMTTADGRWAVMTREGASSRRNGIVVLDLQDPAHPKSVAEYTETVTGGVHSAFVYTQPKYGTHVYLTNSGTGALNIVDINDPMTPRRVAEWYPKEIAAGRALHDIDVKDGIAYVSYWSDGLVILDVGNGMKGGRPDAPVLISNYRYNAEKLYPGATADYGPGFISGTHTAWRHKNYVFIADEVFPPYAPTGTWDIGSIRAYGRLQVVDVTNIEHPKPVAWYEPEYGGVHNVWAAGDTLYIGAYNAGFHALDVSGELRGDLKAQGREITDMRPSDMNGVVPNRTMTWGVVVKDGLAYVNDMISGLWIVRLRPRTVVP